jgi:hypothetical protein
MFRKTEIRHTGKQNNIRSRLRTGCKVHAGPDTMDGRGGILQRTLYIGDTTETQISPEAQVRPVVCVSRLDRQSLMTFGGELPLPLFLMTKGRKKDGQRASPWPEANGKLCAPKPQGR